MTAIENTRLCLHSFFIHTHLQTEYLYLLRLQPLFRIRTAFWCQFQKCSPQALNCFEVKFN